MANPFDPKNLLKGRDGKIKYPSVGIVGASQSGKSQLFKDLYRKVFHKNFNTVVCISETLANGFYQSFLPKKTIFVPAWDQSLVGSLLRFQDDHSGSKMLIILDDVMDRKLRNDDEMDRLFSTARHYRIAVCYLCHASTRLSPQMRKNLSHLVIFSVNASDHDTFYESVYSPLIRMSEVKNGITKSHSKHYAQKTLENALDQGGDYSCAIVCAHDKTPRNTFKDLVYYYKAQM